ncbi:hypothetical protein PCE1_001944 [Barthelona sp. PCE]
MACKFYQLCFYVPETVLFTHFCLISAMHIFNSFSFTKEQFLEVIEFAVDVKAHPENYSTALKGKTLLGLYSKPSLRTRVSFETLMTDCGGHQIYYNMGTSPLGVKESFEDTGAVLSRMVDVVTARVKSFKEIEGLAKHSTIPIINALDDQGHPMQMLADFLTIYEKKGTFEGLKMVYAGDCCNNVTYDLMRTCALLGMDMTVSSPDHADYKCADFIWEEIKPYCEASGSKINWTPIAAEAFVNADVIYADSWFSYGIPMEEKQIRVDALMPYQVNMEMCALANKDHIFMNCLPAMRGYEQTAEVIDGPNSVVFDEAENRLHAQKACLIWMLTDIRPQPKKRLVVALGGNALRQRHESGSFEETYANCVTTCNELAKIIKEGYDITIGHGNGPQVGSILKQNETAAATVPAQPLPICGAMSQGQIGYMLQQALQNTFAREGINQPVATLVTQVEVSMQDPAWTNPQKPIGSFMSEAEARELEKEGKTVKEDSGRGWREVVASPTPISIAEYPAIETLVKNGFAVIASGGGGVPVVRNEDGTLEGRPAVIDKDLATQLMAKMLHADTYMILTDVEFVYVHYRDPEKRKALRDLTVAEAEEYMADGEFAAGSMGPKVKACIKFVKETGRPAIITSLNKALDALNGLTGTKIVPN